MRILSAVAAVAALFILAPGSALAGQCDNLETVLKTAEKSENKSDEEGTKSEFKGEQAACYEAHAEAVLEFCRGLKKKPMNQCLDEAQGELDACLKAANKGKKAEQQDDAEDAEDRKQDRQDAVKACENRTEE